MHCKNFWKKIKELDFVLVNGYWKQIGLNRYRSNFYFLQCFRAGSYPWTRAQFLLYLFQMDTCMIFVSL